MEFWIITALLFIALCGIGMELHNIKNTLTTIARTLNGLSGTAGHELYLRLKRDREAEADQFDVTSDRRS